MKTYFFALIACLSLFGCGSPDDSSSQTADASRFTLNHNVIEAIRNDRVVRADIAPLRDVRKYLCAESVPAEIAQAERRILDLSNAIRQQNGLAPLTLDACASQVARRHSQNMANQNHMDHVLDGKGPADRMRDGGIGFSAVYENIHNWNEYYNNQPTWNFGAYGDRALDFWKNSPPHRANLLNAHVTTIGIGVARSQHGVNGMITSTQNFYRP